MAYEFSKKEIRKSFKENAYGKRVHMRFIVGTAVFIISLIISITMYFSMAAQYDYNIFVVLEKEVGVFCSVVITFLLLILDCYLDGKRDGAISMFEKLKKEKD